MAAITNSGGVTTTLAGDYKLVVFNELALTTASETLTLTVAANSITEIASVFAQATGTIDADFQTVSADFSGLVVTIKSYEGDGTAADEFTATTCNLLVIGK